jgi:hypothetical protein
MNRRNLETLLLTLESTPALVARAAAELDASQVHRVPATGIFSLVEHVWHLADLEREGYEVRIRRILTEDEPSLSDFEGERIARERRYRDGTSRKASPPSPPPGIATSRSYARSGTPTGNAAAPRRDSA